MPDSERIRRVMALATGLGFWLSTKITVFALYLGASRKPSHSLWIAFASCAIVFLLSLADKDFRKRGATGKVSLHFLIDLALLAALCPFAVSQATLLPRVAASTELPLFPKLWLAAAILGLVFAAAWCLWQWIADLRRPLPPDYVRPKLTWDSVAFVFYGMLFVLVGRPLLHALKAHGFPLDRVDQAFNVALPVVLLVGGLYFAPFFLFMKIMDRKRRGEYEAAYKAYRWLLVVTPPIFRMPRQMTLSDLLSLACETGRYEEALRWADMLDRTGGEESIRITGHTMAAQALRALGRDEEAERRTERARTLAQEAPAGDGLPSLQLAQLLREQGKLEEAVAVARRPWKKMPYGSLTAAITAAEDLRALGRPDEAMQTLRRAANAPQDTSTIGNPSTDPELAVLNRQMLALLDLYLAIAATDAGRMDEATAALERAEPVLQANPDYALLPRATAVWVYGAAGRERLARRALDHFLEAKEFLQPKLRQGLLPLVARGCLALGDEGQALALVDEFFQGATDPVTASEMHWLRGESLLRRGERDAARDAFARAADGVETVYAHRAQERLAEGTAD